MVEATKTISLKMPVKQGDTTITSLTVRRPKVKDMLTAQKVGASSDAEAELALFASLTGQTPEVLEQLDMADYLQLQGVYKGFLS